MTTQVKVVIADKNSYFVFGLKSLLTQHFVKKGKSVIFLSHEKFMNADIFFHRSGRYLTPRWCLKNETHRQCVLSVRDKVNYRTNTNQNLPHCLSEKSIINYRTKIEELLREVDRVLECKMNETSIQNCPRCSPMLTTSERLILSEISNELSQTQIAVSLKLSIKTVSSHKCSAMRKLGFRTNSELYYWLRCGGLDNEMRAYI